MEWGYTCGITNQPEPTVHRLTIDFDATYTKTTHNGRVMYVGPCDIWYESARVAGRFYLVTIV